jgi:hypothetical protein
MHCTVEASAIAAPWTSVNHLWRSRLSLSLPMRERNLSQRNGRVPPTSIVTSFIVWFFEAPRYSNRSEASRTPLAARDREVPLEPQREVPHQAASRFTFIRHPRAVEIFTSASSEKREIRPRSRSLILGCVTPARLAASACAHRRLPITAAICCISSARARRFAACPGVSAIASHTLAWLSLFSFHTSLQLRKPSLRASQQRTISNWI